MLTFYIFKNNRYGMLIITYHIKAIYFGYNLMKICSLEEHILSVHVLIVVKYF